MPGAMESSAFETFLAEVRAFSVRAPDSTLQLFVPQGADLDFFNRLCDGYPALSARQRIAVEDAARSSLGMLNHLLGFIYFCAEKLKADRNAVWLARGLSAAVLQESRLDLRDYLLALAELYVAAEECGLDPVPAFAAAGGAVPADFGKYAVVAGRRRG